MKSSRTKGDMLMKKPGLMKIVLSFVALVPLTYLGAADAEAYKVLVLGDVHYDAPELHAELNYVKRPVFRRNVNMWKKATPELLTLAAKRAEAEKPEFAIQLGDIVQGDGGNAELQKRMLRAGFAAVKKYFPRLPLWVVKGNHDVRLRIGSNDNAPANEVLMPLVAAEFGISGLENGNHAFRRGRDLYISVDGFIPAPEVAAFVKKALEDNADARYVFLLTHLPVLPADPAVPFWLLPGHYEVAELLETRPSVILAAHTHVPSIGTRVTARGKIVQLVVTSMGCEWNPKSVMVPRFDSWQKVLEYGKTLRAAGMNRGNDRRWPVLASKGDYTFREFFRNSGFVMLDVDDERVAARYFIDGGDAPGARIVLFERRK